MGLREVIGYNWMVDPQHRLASVVPEVSQNWMMGKFTGNPIYITIYIYKYIYLMVFISPWFPVFRCFFLNQSIETTMSHGKNHQFDPSTDPRPSPTLGLLLDRPPRRGGQSGGAHGFWVGSLTVVAMVVSCG